MAQALYAAVSTANDTTSALTIARTRVEAMNRPEWNGKPSMLSFDTLRAKATKTIDDMDGMEWKTIDASCATGKIRKTVQRPIMR